MFERRIYERKKKVLGDFDTTWGMEDKRFGVEMWAIL